MTEILQSLHQYVPCVSSETTKTISTNENIVEYVENMHSILIGGDQVTVARIRAAQYAKRNSERPTKRLDGFIPVIEDWHTKANILDVSQ